MKTKEKALSENKRNLIVLEIIGIAALILGLILGLTISIFILYFGLVFGVAAMLIAPYVYFNEKKRINRSYCPNCATNYDYQNNISWEVASTEENEKNVKAIVDFECTCSKCGNTVNFSEKFVIASYNNEKHRWEKYNISNLARKYFIK